MKRTAENARRCDMQTRREKKSPFEELYPQAFQIKKNIELLCAVYGTPQSDMAEVIGCSDWTLRDRMKNPWKFSIDELTRAAKLWSMTPADLMQPLVLVPQEV